MQGCAPYCLVTVSGLAQVAIKFESCNSKGLSRNGTPHEWAVYQKIAGLYGIPKVFAKGQIGQYYTMVRRWPAHLMLLQAVCQVWKCSQGILRPGWACMHAQDAEWYATERASMQLRVSLPPRSVRPSRGADSARTPMGPVRSSSCRAGGTRPCKVLYGEEVKTCCWAGHGAAGPEPVGRVERARRGQHARALRRLRRGRGAPHPGGPPRAGVRPCRAWNPHGSPRRACWGSEVLT